MLAQRTGQCQGLGTKDPDVLNFYIGVGGNHVWIRSDDGVYALHAHMIPGSISSSICPKNATKFTNPSSSGWIAPEAAVTNGVHITCDQYLGLAGNSGNSTGPHLHVHMAKNDAVYNMPFAHGSDHPVRQQLGLADRSMDHAEREPVADRPDPDLGAALDRLLERQQHPGRTHAGLVQPHDRFGRNAGNHGLYR
ncbi:M23 family metallopeptidase [Massilia sp. B-10]|nr:M23 family metallopeptidase [Massilia sp. B-10]